MSILDVVCMNFRAFSNPFNLETKLKSIRNYQNNNNACNKYIIDIFHHCPSELNSDDTMTVMRELLNMCLIFGPNNT